MNLSELKSQLVWVIVFPNQDTLLLTISDLNSYCQQFSRFNFFLRLLSRRSLILLLLFLIPTLLLIYLCFIIVLRMLLISLLLGRSMLEMTSLNTLLLWLKVLMCILSWNCLLIRSWSTLLSLAINKNLVKIPQVLQLLLNINEHASSLLVIDSTRKDLLNFLLRNRS